MRFSDGSYFKVVLPLLKVWHAQVGKSFKLSDIGIEVEQSDPGVENSEKHIDTKLVIIADNDRLVLHVYNSTQNLMVQGRNFEHFAVNYLEPFFTQKINEQIVEIENININVQKIQRKSK